MYNSYQELREKYKELYLVNKDKVHLALILILIVDILFQNYRISSLVDDQNSYYSNKEIDQNISQVESDQSNNEKEFSSLRDDISDVAIYSSSLNSKVSNLNDNISNLEKSISDLELRISNLENK